MLNYYIFPGSLLAILGIQSGPRTPTCVGTRITLSLLEPLGTCTCVHTCIKYYNKLYSRKYSLVQIFVTYFLML